MKLSYERISELPDFPIVANAFEGPVIVCPFHFHPEIEIVFIDSSFGQVTIGDYQGSFQAGDLYIIGPNQPHLFVNDEKNSTSEDWARVIVLQFPEHVLGSEFWKENNQAAPSRLLQTARGGLVFRGESTRRAADTMRMLIEAQNFSRTILFLQILDLLSSERLPDPLSHDRDSRSTRIYDVERVDRAIQHIREHIAEPLSLHAIASKSGLSENAFSRIFRRVTGKRFKEYLNEARIATACKLLIETDQTIIQIALAVGYNNLSNFNRRFREIRSLSPREFRKQFTQTATKQLNRAQNPDQKWRGQKAQPHYIH